VWHLGEISFWGKGEKNRKAGARNVWVWVVLQNFIRFLSRSSISYAAPLKLGSVKQFTQAELALDERIFPKNLRKEELAFHFRFIILNFKS
jgi:hypothetical protein